MTITASWISKKSNRCGGDACVRDTRITVWGLVAYHRLGETKGSGVDFAEEGEEKGDNVNYFCLLLEGSGWGSAFFFRGRPCGRTGLTPASSPFGCPTGPGNLDRLSTKST